MKILMKIKKFKKILLIKLKFFINNNKLKVILIIYFRIKILN